MAVVIVPAVVLSILAIRAISHEEAYIEKQLEGTLSAEVAHVATMIAAEMDGVRAELGSSAVVPPAQEPSRALRQWKAQSALVDIPFLLGPDREILWPVVAEPAPQGAAETDEVSAFIEEQEAFFSDREEVAVYENITVAYQNEILSDTEEILESATIRPLGDRAAEDVEAGAADRPAPAVPVRGGRAEEVRSYSAGGAVGRTRSVEAEEPLAGSAVRKQVALNEFQKSAPVRKKVYEKAEREGLNIGFRNVQVAGGTGPEQQVVTGKATVGAAPSGKKKEKAGERAGDRRLDAAAADAGRIKSIFVSQPLKFSEIVAGESSGLIPRKIDGNFRVLYWQRISDDRILGCLIESGELMERIVGALPDIHSPTRILTVLDDRGVPLIVPQNASYRDWHRPFVAQEISEVLPRWEAAAYLTDPGLISARADVAARLAWVVISILFVTIVAGGILVLRSAHAEAKLARQRTTFVANVSHELKTPLTSIRMFAEMLREGRQPDETKRRQYLDIMAAETERLTRLINNVLDFSRMERGEKRYSMGRCDLVVLCAALLENQRARLENSGFEVVFSKVTGGLPVNADDEALQQAILNLISNAEKYSGDSKKIEVEVSREGGSAVVCVSDRGVGIPAGDAERIFDEFYRVDEELTSKVKGAGLGLTIARRIIRDHGGDIRYHVRSGGGSTFKILLPLVEDRV
jgi:signal transduction histidine kinase